MEAINEDEAKSDGFTLEKHHVIPVSLKLAEYACWFPSTPFLLSQRRGLLTVPSGDIEPGTQIKVKSPSGDVWYIRCPPSQFLGPHRQIVVLLDAFDPGLAFRPEEGGDSLFGGENDEGREPFLSPGGGGGSPVTTGRAGVADTVSEAGTEPTVDRSACGNNRLSDQCKLPGWMMSLLTIRTDLLTRLISSSSGYQDQIRQHKADVEDEPDSTMARAHAALLDLVLLPHKADVVHAFGGPQGLKPINEPAGCTFRVLGKDKSLTPMGFIELLKNGLDYRVPPYVAPPSTSREGSRFSNKVDGGSPSAVLVRIERAHSHLRSIIQARANRYSRPRPDPRPYGLGPSSFLSFSVYMYCLPLTGFGCRSALRQLDLLCAGGGARRACSFSSPGCGYD